MLFVPSAVPHILQYLAPSFNIMTVVSEPAFMHHEPGTFYGVARIKETTICMINQTAIRAHNFHENSQVMFKEISFNFGDTLVYQLSERFAIYFDVTKDIPQLLGSNYKYHVSSDALRWSCWLKLWYHDSWLEAVSQINLKSIQSFFDERFIFEV